jgi:beta-lactamase class A
MNKSLFLSIFSLVVLFGVLFLSSGCSDESQITPTEAVSSQERPTPAPTATAEALQPSPTSPLPTPAATETAVAEPTVPAARVEPTAVLFPIYTYGDVVACGQALPIVSSYDGPLVASLSPDPAALQSVLDRIPEEARPALEQMLRAPETVGLTAYRVGEEANGAYLNENVPLPLASVVKVLHLIAYAEAVAAGELSPTETVLLEDLDRFYLPTLDLRAHEEALEELEADGRLFGQPPALILDEVVRMMVEFSSNAATDYLHMRLGQERIEATAREMGLVNHTAPCPFAGQFLAMANHTRPQVSGQMAFDFYIANPQLFGEEVMQLTAAFSEDPAFHDEAIAWRRESRRPTGRTQRLFSEELNAQGTAVEYAALMARLALNGLSSGESSYLARQHMEWPMRFFDNQELFTNLAYKGGSLPGILTTVYYAYPIGETNPTVVALFFHDLPGSSTYRQWRSSLAHDEFARWMLYDPQAIPALRALLESGG